MKWERHLVKTFKYEDIVASKESDEFRIKSEFTS